MYLIPGFHRIGKERCLVFRDRIYNETNIDSSFAKMRQDQCPKNITGGRKNLAPLDLQTPTAFDNNYYKNLIVEKGLLHSDQQLYNGGSTDSLVKTYSNNVETFNKDFVTAKIKMQQCKMLFFILSL
jgi:peroxidase